MLSLIITQTLMLNVEQSAYHKKINTKEHMCKFMLSHCDQHAFACKKTPET